MSYTRKCFLLTIFLLASAIISFSQTKPANCLSYRTGTFAYRDSSSNSIREFKRTRNHQVEKDKQTGLVTRYKIEWVADCEYKLTQVYANKKEARKKNNSWLLYKVIPVTENAYSYQCRCNDNTEINGTVVKME